MPCRFVILHHKTADGEHWDLMLQHGDALLTWRLSKEPAAPDDFPIPATRIADHRQAYLEYEGPISGGRGAVRRVDSGTFDFELQHGTEIGMKVAGKGGASPADSERSVPTMPTIRVCLRGKRWSLRCSLPVTGEGMAQCLSHDSG